MSAKDYEFIMQEVQSLRDCVAEINEKVELLQQQIKSVLDQGCSVSVPVGFDDSIYTDDDGLLNFQKFKKSRLKRESDEE